ncbi:MAG TPA: RING finger protein [Caproiciproducens sp.]|nr:RING finger protein [Caproiciproducens sp.]
MTDYTGMKCPVCGNVFTASDDIVVCPDCGAPYHRECYAHEGKCVFTEKHGTPDAWKPPEKTEDNRKNDSAKRCPRCGFPNSENALFCEHCGQSLTNTRQDFQGSPQNGGYQPFGSPFPNQPGDSPQGGFPGQQVPFVFDPMGGVNPNEPIDDVPAGDVAKLVQNNTQYYLPTFIRMKRFGQNRFNFSAFLFAGGWMLYRKQYKLGAIITSIMGALYLFYIYASIYFSAPLYASLLKQVGASADTISPSYDQLVQMSELLAKLPMSQVIWFFIPTIIALFQFIIMIVVGINGNRWYLKHCVAKVGKIRTETKNSTENAIRLQEEGGVNTALAICLLLCYMILMYIPNF